MLNADAHDQRTISTLRRTFDGVLEVAGDGAGGSDAPSVRVSGLDGVPDDWIPIG